MITIRQDRFIAYSRIDNSDNNPILYPELFNGEIIELINNAKSNDRKESIIQCLAVGLTQLTRKIYSNVQSDYGSKIYIFLKKTNFKVNDIETDIEPGSVIIFRTNLASHLEPQKENIIVLYENSPLTHIYTTTKLRVEYANRIRATLEIYKKLPIMKQCLQKELDLKNIVGSGCYGNVFESSMSNKLFAIKFSKLKKEDVENPNASSWHEISFLKDILKPIIEKGSCPNLPLLYDDFSCEKCKLILKGTEEHHPCLILAVELANGDLKKYINDYSPNIDKYMVAIFQIMAGLHAIQLKQIMNFDIKKENILFYNVNPGGYWHYVIKNVDFYIPNYGQVFILNDFGISRSLSPQYRLSKTKDANTYRIGHRFAKIVNGEFVPIVSKTQIDDKGQLEKSCNISWINNKIKSNGSQFRITKDTNKIIPPIEENFNNPEVVPPFEFYNDTQDAIRMFIGGKRTTQKGNHKPCKMATTLIKELEKYIGPSNSMSDFKFTTDPAQVLASYFILSFFNKDSPLRVKPKNEKKLATYILS